MGHLAEALGVRKGSLYSLTGSKQELLFETMREGARVSRGARRGSRRLCDRADSACAARTPRRRRRPTRRRHRLHAGVALLSTGSTEAISPSGAATRSDSARSSRTEWPVRSVPIWTRGPPRSSCSRQRTGRTRGSPPDATRTSSPTASPRSSSTASAATRRPGERSTRQSLGDWGRRGTVGKRCGRCFRAGRSCG